MVVFSILGKSLNYSSSFPRVEVVVVAPVLPVPADHTGNTGLSVKEVEAGRLSHLGNSSC